MQASDAWTLYDSVRCNAAGAGPVILRLWLGQVNNAGLGRNNAALFDGSTASWVEMISTNVLGVCMCTREALKVRSLHGCLPHLASFAHYMHTCCA